VLDELGRRLAELRRGKSWTQQEAADRAGMLLRDYQAIESGGRAITIRTALALAQAFDVPLRTLFDPPTSIVPRRVGRPPQDETAVASESAPASATPKRPGAPKKRSTRVDRG
jgi:transcriptional regulator with XRE-family HTH domain